MIILPLAVSLVFKYQGGISMTQLHICYENRLPVDLVSRPAAAPSKPFRGSKGRKPLLPVHFPSEL